MSMLQEDFRVRYEILKIGSIKSWGEVTVDGVTHPPSVKFRSTNIETKDDPRVGTREVETIVDFQIKDKDLENIVKLQEVLRKFRADNKPVYFVGDLPNKEGADKILVVRSTIPLEEFCKLNKITL